MNLTKTAVRRLITGLSAPAFLLVLVPLSLLAQDTQYAQGLILDYYVIQNDPEVEGPTGRSMATLLDTSPPQMSYLGPFEIEASLEQFNDKFWGLHWTGFLRVEDSGAYSFNLMVNTTNDYYVRCQSWLKIQDRVVAAHELTEFRDGNSNAYGDINMRPGIYGFEVWFACNKGNTRVKEKRPSIAINMRGPNDAMLKPIPKNQLLHEL